MKSDYYALCEKLKKERLKAEIPARYIANRIGCTVANIYRFESGHNDSLSIYLEYRKLGLDG